MNNNIIKTNSDCAKYTGTVTVSTYLGDRLIQSETHHNKGMKNLFEFMSCCLQGNWYEASYTRPCKLVMLRAEEGELLKDSPDKSLPANAPGGDWSTPSNKSAKNSKTGEHFWGSAYAVCNPVMFDNAPVSTSDSTSSSVTYHFRVPFLSLVAGSNIKKLMLLPPVASDYTEDACAYFVLNNAIPVPEMSANFTVIIDWTLTFTNS